MERVDRQAMLVSGALHAVFFAIVAGAALWAMFFKPKPPEHVFELVSASAPAPQAQQAQATPEPARQPQPMEDIQLPSLDELENIPTLEFPSAPQPEPPPPPPKPQARPEPKPQVKPQPQPEPKPQKISAEDFFKQHKRPDPKPQAAPSRKPVEVQRIEVDRAALVSSFDSVSDRRQFDALSQLQQEALARYNAALKSRLNAAWEKPGGLSGEMSAQVRFKVLANGTLTDVRIIQPSGNPAFDQSALTAFRAVGRFQPTPDGQSYTLRLTFRLSD